MWPPIHTLLSPPLRQVVPSHLLLATFLIGTAHELYNGNTFFLYIYLLGWDWSISPSPSPSASYVYSFFYLWFCLLHFIFSSPDCVCAYSIAENYSNSIFLFVLRQWNVLTSCGLCLLFVLHSSTLVGKTFSLLSVLWFVPLSKLPMASFAKRKPKRGEKNWRYYKKKMKRNISGERDFNGSKLNESLLWCQFIYFFFALFGLFVYLYFSIPYYIFLVLDILYMLSILLTLDISTYLCPPGFFDSMDANVNICDFIPLSEKQSPRYYYVLGSILHTKT
jgi:hypothetical protein